MDKPNPDPKDAAKRSFVPKEDRPEVKISLDTPLSELRVRELGSILGLVAAKNPNFEVGKTSLKDFFDKDFPEVAKDWVKEIKSEKFEKIEKLEKPEKLEKLEKYEKLEKNEKHEKNEKLEKYEKHEKPELKELKNEKLEREPIFEPGIPGPDPMLQQVIQAVAGLTNQVAQLANQVEELRKKVEK
jgi:hypothetical protein